MPVIPLLIQLERPVGAGGYDARLDGAALQPPAAVESPQGGLDGQDLPGFRIAPVQVLADERQPGAAGGLEMHGVFGALDFCGPGVFLKKLLFNGLRSVELGSEIVLGELREDQTRWKEEEQ